MGKRERKRGERERKGITFSAQIQKVPPVASPLLGICSNGNELSGGGWLDCCDVTEGWLIFLFAWEFCSFCQIQPSCSSQDRLPMLLSALTSHVWHTLLGFLGYRKDISRKQKDSQSRES